MKIELDLNDDMVEAILERKRALGQGATINDAAMSALSVGLKLRPKTEEPTFIPKRSPKSIGELIASLGSASMEGGRPVGVIGVKMGEDGKMEIQGGEDLPDGIVDLVQGLATDLNKAFADGTFEDDCQCDNCVARRAAKSTKFC